MEAQQQQQQQDETSTGTEIEEPDQEEEIRASKEAIDFMLNIEPAELQKCVLSDSLTTVSQGGQDLGNFSMTVDFGRKGQQSCMLLHALSQGAIDGSPCGTSVTVHVATDLEVLEENYHEYIKLEGRSLDIKCHMVQCDGQMVISRVTTIEEVVTRESVSYPMSVLRGLVTEGSHLLLMRLFALRRQVPENMKFITLDKALGIKLSLFGELGLKQMEIGDEMVEVFGVEKVVKSVSSTKTWQSYFLDDGHLASRVQLRSPAKMILLSVPSYREKVPEKVPLIWETDMQMRSKFLDRKEELNAEHALYLRQHPEIRALISDFLQFLLLRKPENVLQFSRDYFLPFSSRNLPEPGQEASIP
ncbi:ciliogenesis-associated TTC17-interacting protein [Nelusetta ayraudi]|uniref:ciliogenesis-associated TTC17-interacting protein n=1 Tax=Nelusetta ayraudi TaxID=303726 RepID=UPI003F6FAF1A